MEQLAVNEKNGYEIFKAKTAGKSSGGSEAFLQVLRGAGGAPGTGQGPVREARDDKSLHSIFGEHDPDAKIQESAKPRDDARDDSGADEDFTNREAPRPRESAPTGDEDSRSAAADAAPRERDSAGADAPDHSETDARMARNAQDADDSGKGGGDAGAGNGQNGAENQNTGAETAAAAAAAPMQGAVIPGAAEGAAGQAQRGTQGQAAEGQNQTAAQTAAQAAQAQAKSAGADSGGAHDRRQAQEQDIAAKLKPGQAVKVEVKTTDESKTLVSRPAAATLTEGADEAAGQFQRTGAGAQNTATIAQQAQLAQAQNQGQNAAQAAGTAQQTQIQTAAVQTAAKGPAAPGPQAVGPSGGAATGGGETAQAPNQTAQTRSETPQQTEQARQNTNAQDTHQTRARVIEQISVQIAKAAAGKNDRIQISLKPAELGRVEIQIEMTHDGRAAAVVTADNKETLEMLRRDASELAKALQDAGLKTGAGDLSFNLRGENAHADAGDGSAEGGLFDGEGEDGDGTGLAAGEDTPQADDARIPPPVGVRGLAGVNLTA